MTSPATMDIAAEIISRCTANGDDLFTLLSALQNTLGFIPPPCIALIGESLDVDRASIYKSIEISPSLSLKTPGDHLVYVCSADNCCAKGGLVLAATAKRVLGVDFFHCDATNCIRIEPFRCLANCENGPNVMIDQVVYGPISPKDFEDRLLALIHQKISR